MTSPTRDRGFTLIEMIVVVAILALAIGIVVQRGPFRSAAVDLRAAAEEVGRTLRLARVDAIAADRTVVFRMDVTRHMFAVDGGPARALPEAFSLAMVAVAPGALGRVPSIAFAPDGSSSGGRITLGEGGRRIDIGVDWLTGRVSMGRLVVADAG